MGDTVVARTDFDEVRCAGIATQVNRHAQRIQKHRQVPKDACRPEQRVSVTRNRLHTPKPFTVVSSVR